MSPPPAPGRKRDYSRRRAGCLLAVYALMAAHVVHWKLAGTTLAPLELNEVLYTLELGIVTAGFIFMAAALLSVFVFGRFFCSWGCHILALEDLFAWLLRKARLRPKPVRSRALLLVPPAALFYMFIWPHIARLLRGTPPASLHVVHEGQGWASFLTTDFWRNLPSPAVTLLTFAICGFLIVYVLGSRSFCRYGCPYGALFALADRVAPGRIVARGNCTRCGRCTAGCQSNIRVHEELTVFGQVVSPSCLRDLDCLAACPEGAIGYRFTRPPLFKSFSRAVRRPRFDATPAEEVLMAVTFTATLFIFRGLYDAVPFLLTLGLGGILARLAMLAWRLRGSANVRLNRFQLKRGGRITPAGRGFAAACALMGAFTAHSAFIRYHEHAGARAYDRAVQAAMATDGGPVDLGPALHHLALCDRWGLLHPARLDERLASLHLLAGAPEAAAAYLERVVRRSPARGDELVGDARAARGDGPGAIAAYEAVLAVDADHLHAHAALGELRAGQGRFAEAARHFRAALAQRPASAPLHYNLGLVLAQLGRSDDAIGQYRAAARLAPRDAEIRNNLGFELARHGDRAGAEAAFRAALRLDPRLAHAHFNLGRLLLAGGRTEEARAQLRQAARLDDRYAGILGPAAGLRER